MRSFFHLAAGVSLFICLTASLSFADNTGIYLGAGVGQSAIKISDTDPSFGNFDVDSDDTAWKAFLGWRPLGFLAVEAGYRDFGSGSDSSGTLRSAADVNAFDASVLGILPVGPIDVFARAGLVAWDAEVKLNDGSTFEKTDYDSEDLIYGAGLGFRLGSLGVRGEYEIIDANEFSDIEMWNLNAFFMF